MKAIQRQNIGRSPHDLVVEDVCVSMKKFQFFMISHVKRMWNSVAHLCARLVPFDGREEVFVSNFPQGLLALAELDFGNKGELWKIRRRFMQIWNTQVSIWTAYEEG